jgi:hypothetical protein
LLQDYLNKIVDLRSKRSAQRPDIRIAGTGYVHIDLLAEAQQMAQASIAAPAGKHSQTHEYMLALYRELALSLPHKRVPAVFPGAAQFLRKKVCCFIARPAKTDRHCRHADSGNTGSARTIDLSGLPANQQHAPAGKCPSACPGCRQVQPGPTSRFGIALQVDSRYLDRFYTTVEQHYGSMNGYLQSAICLDLHSKRQLQRYLGWTPEHGWPDMKKPL